jgi:CheY-like chemotaxis protein
LPRKILLADDSVTAQNMGKKILTDAGYEVTTVSNGSAALKKVLDNPPDLIVLDVYMPGHSGLEVCRRLKESANTAHIPILLTVGKLEPFKPDEARKARAEAFVVKPFEASELIAMVKRLETEPPKPPETKPSRKKRKLAEIFAASAIVETPDPNVAEIQEEGWRERLSVPPPHAEEKDEAPEVGTWGTGFRDLSPAEAENHARRDSAFTAEPFVASSLPLTPQDATQEEIAALQAAAALLAGKDPAAANIPSVEAVSLKEPETVPDATDASASPSVQTDGEKDGEKKDAVAAEAKPASEPAQVEAAQAEAAAVVAASTQFAPPEPGVIDQSEEPLFAPEFQPKVEVATPAPQEEAKKEEEIKKEEEKKAEEVSAPPVAAAPVAEGAAETAPVAEPEKKEEVAPVEAVGQAQEPIPAAAAAPEEPTPAIAAAPAAEIPVATPEGPAEAAIVAEAPKETPVASLEAEPAKEIEQKMETEPVAAAEAVAETKPAESACWTAVSVALAGEETGVALEREMADFHAVAATVEGVAHPAVESAIAVAEASVVAAVAEQIVAVPAIEGAHPVVQDFPVVAEATQQTVQEQPVAAIAEPARAAAVAAGAETSPEASIAAAPAPEKPSSETEMDASTTADMQAAWANWREIRESIVGSSVSQNVVDLVSSVAGPAEATPEKEPESTQTAGDPAAIANIVDSVLAELKPKIVEEIAKKLKKKK